MGRKNGEVVREMGLWRSGGARGKERRIWRQRADWEAKDCLGRQKWSNTHLLHTHDCHIRKYVH